MCSSGSLARRQHGRAAGRDEKFCIIHNSAARASPEHFRRRALNLLDVRHTRADTLHRNAIGYRLGTTSLHCSLLYPHAYAMPYTPLHSLQLHVEPLDKRRQVILAHLDDARLELVVPRPGP